MICQNRRVLEELAGLTYLTGKPNHLSLHSSIDWNVLQFRFDNLRFKSLLPSRILFLMFIKPSKIAPYDVDAHRWELWEYVVQTRRNVRSNGEEWPIRTSSFKTTRAICATLFEDPHEPSEFCCATSQETPSRTAWLISCCVSFATLTLQDTKNEHI